MNVRDSLLKLQNSDCNLSIVVRNNSYPSEPYHGLFSINNNKDNNEQNVVKDIKLSWNVSNKINYYDDDDDDDGDDDNNDDYDNKSKNDKINNKTDNNNSIKVDLEAVWKLQHVEKLFFWGFPYASLTTTKQIINNNNDFDNDTSKTPESSSELSSTEVTSQSSSSHRLPSHHFSYSIGSLYPTLQELQFCGCRHDDFHLPSPEIGMLVNLIKLSITNCTLEYLPSDIGKLQSLQILELHYVRKLQSLPSLEIGNLHPTLQSLSIMECESLITLPIAELCHNYHNNNTSLRVLEIYDNEKLQSTNVFHNVELDRFTNLQTLVMEWKLIMFQYNLQLPISLEILVLKGFYCTDLSTLVVTVMTTTTAPSNVVATKEESKLSVTPLSLPTTTTKESTTTKSSTQLSTQPSQLLFPLFSSLPLGIQMLKIQDFCTANIPITPINQNVIHTTLERYPQLFMEIGHDRMSRIGLELELELVLPGIDKEGHKNSSSTQSPLGLFTNKSLHLNYLNRCGRILLLSSSSTSSSSDNNCRSHNNNNHDDNNMAFVSKGKKEKDSVTTLSSHQISSSTTTRSTTIPSKQQSPQLSQVLLLPTQRPLPLSMWPIVLEQVNERIGTMINKKSKQIMEASVIFSLLQGPALMERTRL